MKIEINIYTMNKLYILLLLPFLSCTTYDYVNANVKTYYAVGMGKEKKEKQKKTIITKTTEIDHWGCK